MSDGTQDTGRPDARQRAGRQLRRSVVSIHTLQIPLLFGLMLAIVVLAGEQTDPEQLLMLGVTHLILLVSAAVFFYVGRFERRDPPAPRDTLPSGVDERGGTQG